MTPSLQKAIEGIYDAFRDVPKPTTVPGCPCCISEKEICILLSKPLRDLSPDELTQYASSALLTVGAVEDFVYFLPRILEVLATTSGWWRDPEVVARAIHVAGFHSWPEVRHKSISHYLDEIINDLLVTENSGSELDSWICAIARLQIDLTPFLARIAANRPRLIEYYENNSSQLADGRLANAFWDDAPQGQKQVIDWFRSPETQQAIKEQYGLA